MGPFYKPVETGLYYLNSRYYNPEIGRFINADGLIGPIGGILTHNMYAYGLNNPIMNVDPNGDFALSFGVAAITSIAPFVLPALAVVATVALVAYVAVNYDEIEAGFKNKVGVYNDSNLKENREIPDVKYPGDDPTKSPGEDWKWK